MKRLILAWFPTVRVAYVLVALWVCAVVSTWVPVMLQVTYALMCVSVIAMLIETVMLWKRGASVAAWRTMEDKLSNGEFNVVRVHIDVTYPHDVELTIIDELPFQLQERKLHFPWMRYTGSPITLSYEIRPVTRGTYSFGSINVFVRGRMGLVQRRFQCDAQRAAYVHPSIMEMRRADLATFSSQRGRYGVHRQRRLGHTMEFEKVSQYVPGDDVRTINWKATARRSSLMVNQYQDEQSQDVYSAIDLGRSMRYANDGMTMLDYAVNSALAFSNVVIKKHDRVGLITYGSHSGSILPAQATKAQLGAVMRRLYNVETDFAQSDDEQLIEIVRSRIRSRSLVMLFTNIESVDATRRRLPAFRLIARSHVLVVNFFDNLSIRELVSHPSENVEGIYRQAIARSTVMEKKEIFNELRRAGIYAVLSPPNGLSVHAINAYLDLKARGVV